MLSYLTRIIIALAVFAGLSGYRSICLAQDPDNNCDFSSINRAVYWTTVREMSLKELAAYCAPVFWFSPDEPTTDDKEGKEIRMPAPLPFEEDRDKPVVYYQYNRILVREDTLDTLGPGYIPDAEDKGNGMLDLHNIVAVNLKYIAYFPEEEGLGGHAHDVEPTEYRIIVIRDDELKNYDHDCEQTHYLILIMRVTAEAHGLRWFYNVLETDTYTRFPMHLLVEEGKHGMCTDKNSDGYYTPGFDVNHRVNDAWGLRDIIRGGALFTGDYKAWMSKVRRPEHRVFPPLPEDSPLRERHSENGEYAPENAIYELRAFPASEMAGDDALLALKMAEKEKRDWPEIEENTDLNRFGHFMSEELALKAFAISMRADGDLGMSFVFPFFIVRNLEDPVAGGFLVHRMYLKDRGLRDFGWMLMYTPSASRWIDSYFAAGVEWDQEPISKESKEFKTKTDFVLETGIKFRVNITKSPLKFLSFLTDYMGLRAGVKSKGFFDIDRLTYVIEFGAGVF